MRSFTKSLVLTRLKENLIAEAIFPSRVQLLENKDNLEDNMKFKNF